MDSLIEGMSQRQRTLRAAVIAILFLTAVMGALLLWQRHFHPVSGQELPRLRLTSRNFPDGSLIPRQFTCDGENISPQFQWQAAPAGVRSYALEIDDRDAPSDFLHWLVYNLPPSTQELPAGVSPQGALPSGAEETANSYGRPGYAGPCPPPGKPHHYVIRVFALDTVFKLPASATRQEVEAALWTHRLAEGQLVGVYQHNR